ncbi:MAG: D-glycero-alpha-D-manno-heptose-1,7-bisphosphate 7-phosphatase [Clostridium sp.]
MEKVIFLDRDGTLNVEVNYLHRKEDLVLLPGVPEALKAFKDQGYKLVVITNQAGVARGYYTEEDVKELHRYMNELLAGQGAGIDAFYYCPHHPANMALESIRFRATAASRKPGCLEMAEQDFEVDKASSWMIGDKLIDIGGGRNYGVRTVVVGTGYGAGVHDEQKKKGDFPYDLYADDLPEAYDEINRETAGNL